MKKKIQYIVLGILFFLPVMFLLFLIPAKHNYTPLDIIKSDVSEINGKAFETNHDVVLNDHISVIMFLGSKPGQHTIAASNLKELIYDKFQGFKTFQIIAIAPENTQDEVEKLRSEISTYQQLKYWH